MSRDPAPARSQLLRAEMQSRASEEDGRSDSTSRRHPFLGMAAHQDTVEFAHETPTQFRVVHRLRMYLSLWIMLFLFALYPFSILLNDHFQWLSAPGVSSDVKWYCLLAIGLMAGGFFGYLLSTPRWIDCDLQEQTLTYRIGGLRRFASKIDLQDVDDVSIAKHFVVRKGGTRHDIPAFRETPSTVAGIKYTIRILLKDGKDTYPFVTGNETIANEFVRRLASRIVE